MQPTQQVLIDSIQEFGDALLGEKKTLRSSSSSNTAGDLIVGNEEIRDRAPSQISTASQIEGAPVVPKKKNTLISRELAIQLFTKAR